MKIVEALKKNKFISNLYTNTFGKIKVYFIRRNLKKNLVKMGFEILKEIQLTLDNTKARFYVDFGTLLGIIRDGSLIPGDFDLDLRFYNDKDFGFDELDEALTKVGYEKLRTFYTNDIVTEVTYEKKGITIDFFLAFDNGENDKMYTYIKKEGFQYDKKEDFHSMLLTLPKVKSIEKYKVNDIFVNVPNDYIDYLINEYGEGWNVRNPNWKDEDSPAWTGIENATLGKMIQHKKY